MRDTIVVKFSSASPSWPFERQTPNESGIWKNCRFVFTDQDIECDYWVVFEGVLKEEKAVCSPDNVILFTAEPPMVKNYATSFVKQFSHAVSCHPDLSVETFHREQQSLPWHVGRRQREHMNISFSKNYDELIGMSVVPKSRKLSVITSNKRSTPGHSLRYEFVKRLKEALGEQLDVFGRGVCEIEDKWDAIAPYEFHIVLENCSYSDYWTEKLSDCFLGMAFPFYYGCENLSRYFDPKSFRAIDISNFEESLQTIRQTLADVTYSKAVDTLAVAKDLVLNKYNLFPSIAAIINGQENCQRSPKRLVTVSPERHSAFGFQIMKRRLINKFGSAISRLRSKGRCCA